MTKTRRKGGAVTSTVELTIREQRELDRYARTPGVYYMPKSLLAAHMLASMGLLKEDSRHRNAFAITPKGRRLAGRAELSGRPKQAIVKGSTKPGSRMAKKRRKLTAAERKTPEGRFAVHLRSLMDSKGWQVGDLHKQLSLFDGVSIDKPAIQAWLRGSAMPKAKMLEPLGRALGLKDYREILPPSAE